MRKICADIYIDDRNLGGIKDWSEIWLMLNLKISEQVEKRDKNKLRNFLRF